MADTAGVTPLGLGARRSACPLPGPLLVARFWCFGRGRSVDVHMILLANEGSDMTKPFAQVQNVEIGFCHALAKSTGVGHLGTGVVDL